METLGGIQLGAYNWLRTDVTCYNCKASFGVALQVHIGWCRWDEYRLGDPINWMTADQRRHAAERNRATGFELQNLVEAGSPDWGTFATSAGDEECPQCHAKGTMLVVVKDNIFHEVIFTPKVLPYPEILLPEQLEVFLAERNDDPSER